MSILAQRILFKRINARLLHIRQKTENILTKPEVGKDITQTSMYKPRVESQEPTVKEIVNEAPVVIDHTDELIDIGKSLVKEPDPVPEPVVVEEKKITVKKKKK